MMENNKTVEVVNFGKSVIVPSVQELAKESITHVPSRYLRVQENDNDSTIDCPIDQTSPVSVPVIDLQRLLHADSKDSELDKLHLACKEWGFFQVINHGVSISLLETFKEEVTNFLKLPMEEKKILWQQQDNQEGFGQLFVVSEDQKLDWCDMFYVTTLPLKLRKPHLFDNLPQNIRVTMEAYTVAMKGLAQTILNHMAKALGINEGEMVELFGEGWQSIRMNYYPPCPEPHKAIGITPHSDADSLTILYQLNDIQGLQVKKDGNWVPVIPLENAFVANLGDCMEVLSNGIYRSIEHRATVNSAKERISVATFHSFNIDYDIGPAKSIVGPLNPPLFRTEPLKQYYKGFFARKLNGKSYLDVMRLQGDLNTN
ncbi:protein SRG1-like [Chenopodium quinoa]|uniref:Fe2OG dioxygenase domain-containing protein n=1 Tax=Chenopodium quinoa TaxID=63459 RepID=A0A803MDJ3_CHEQI|nr:protein SRG1-like [Chenopodium quinoa]